MPSYAKTRFRSAYEMVTKPEKSETGLATAASDNEQIPLSSQAATFYDDAEQRNAEWDIGHRYGNADAERSPGFEFHDPLHRSTHTMPDSSSVATEANGNTDDAAQARLDAATAAHGLRGDANRAPPPPGMPMHVDE